MKYFAYGSNMSSKRLNARVLGANIIGVYSLKQYDLRFQNVGSDGSGKCNAFFTGSDHTIFGVLYYLDASEKTVLDGFERGYQVKKVVVTSEFGQNEDAFTYSGKASDSDVFTPPFCWYKQHVVAGAIEAGLPEQYLNQLKAITAQDDPDPARIVRELAIYSKILSDKDM